MPDSTRLLSRLATAGSLEMSAHRPQDAAAIAARLSPGAAIFVNHLPRHSLTNLLEAVKAVRGAGLEPVPHLAARRVASREELAKFLHGATAAGGVKRALLVGGDLDLPAGPYPDASSLLTCPALRDVGLGEVFFAAYPEAHPRIAAPLLHSALIRKLDIAAELNLRASVVTQFSFSSRAIIDLLRLIQQQRPDVPVHIGVVGPTNPIALLKFAQTCGVAASLRTLSALGGSVFKLGSVTDPGRDLAPIIDQIENGTLRNVAGLHLFSFGGAIAAAQWLRTASAPTDPCTGIQSENA